ncbi:UNVERIFIED_CONTAM: protein ESSENTIAL FOR POTEXVIRUS ACCUMULATION 1 [Sesamum angustifolium]|uniref:Protein ESSENTIAL FOR POTEXVIRUS ACCUMULATION 1 n=1 Tax=Sesamum angustifolium TaxID=2727405 RepID=A0AAW2LUS7_9LAMI
MFSVHPYAMWNLFVVIAGVTKKGTQIPLSAKTDGRMRKESTVITAGQTDGLIHLGNNLGKYVVPQERWTDSTNRDSHDQRRESKWNTRWGPDDKEADAVREKWGDSIKETDLHLDKGSSQPPYHLKDERDGDHNRPWRSNSSYSRGRADPHHQASTPNKQVPTFSHGRGRTENPAPTFSLGRGRSSFTGSAVTQMAVNLQSRGPIIEKGDIGDGEPHTLKYSRTKLIHIYRTTDMRSCTKFLEGASSQRLTSPSVRTENL